MNFNISIHSHCETAADRFFRFVAKIASPAAIAALGAATFVAQLMH